MWRCCTRVEHGPGACNADAIHESELQNLVVRAINMALGQKDITEYDEQLVRRLIEKITVYDEKVIVEFKSGTSVDIHR